MPEPIRVRLGFGGLDGGFPIYVMVSGGGGRLGIIAPIGGSSECGATGGGA